MNSLTPNEHFVFSSIIFIVKQQSASRHVSSLRYIFSDSKPTSICSFSLLLCA